jgi:hypothetical protein
MKKYLRLSCSVCKRYADRLVDLTRVVPDRCTITLDCQGRLYPIEYRSDGQITAAPATGVTDWYQRTVSSAASPTLPSIALADQASVATSTGSLGQLVLALATPTMPPFGATAVINFAARNDTPKAFKQFSYVEQIAFTLISGIEDAAAKKNLKFNTYTGSDPDIVEVYVNGAKRTQGLLPENYQVFDGTATSAITPNTISFNEAVNIPGDVQVDVIVSKLQTSANQQLTFTRNFDSNIPSGAWGNVSYVERWVGGTWKKFYLFTCNILDNANLILNTIIYPVGTVTARGPAPSTPLIGSFNLSEASFLLARRPFTQVDRYANILIPLTNLDVDRDFLKYHNVSSIGTLEVTDTSIETIFPPVRLVRFNIETTIKVASVGEDEQIVIDGSLITGPDQ